MKFTKMQGLGNDYLYVYGEVPENIEELSIRLSDRHFGAGSDGMIYICTSKMADFKMRVFNADGSEAKMCGNGSRCVGKYVYDKGYTDKTEITVETLSGIKNLKLNVKEGSVKSVSVEMGLSKVEDETEIDVADQKVTLTPVSMGNPHVVLFVDDAEKIPLEVIGPQIEKHSMFPDGVNVEFVSVISDNEIRMRVWERGSGVTMACGTGACASVVASIKKGYCRYDESVFVTLDGGVLEINVSQDGSVIMKGPAEIVYNGEIL